MAYVSRRFLPQAHSASPVTEHNVKQGERLDHITLLQGRALHDLLGIHLQLLIGPIVPVLAPLKVNEALQSVEVRHNDTGRSGCNLTFQIGRGPLEVMIILCSKTRCSSRSTG